MKQNSAIVKTLVIIFAIIGVLATVGAVGMLLMHNSMMGKMGSTSGCQSMMFRSG